MGENRKKYGKNMKNVWKKYAKHVEKIRKKCRQLCVPCRLQVLSVARATGLCCQSNNANKGRQVASQVGSLQSSFVETFGSILVKLS